MTIFVKHPVIFLGYSLSGRNVQTILRSIAECLTPDNIGKLRDHLIFVEWVGKTEPRIGEHTFMIDGLTLPVTQIKVPDFTDVFTVLAELRRSFPAKLLRRLKEQVYDLVLTDDPHHRLVVADIDNTTNDRDVDVVFESAYMPSSVIKDTLVSRETISSMMSPEIAQALHRGWVASATPEVLEISCSARVRRPSSRPRQRPGLRLHRHIAARVRAALHRGTNVSTAGSGACARHRGARARRPSSRHIENHCGRVRLPIAAGGPAALHRGWRQLAN
jgi:hypothetical protein